jgi:ABC-type transport system substrate-binding protein
VGEIDFASLNDKVQADTVMAQMPGATKLTYTADASPGLEFNLRRKPWDDVRVRRAINIGLDRQAVNNTAFFGEGNIGGPSPVVPSLVAQGWGMQPDEFMKLPGWRQPKDQDLAEAKRLLAEAGIPPGFKAVMKFKKGSGQPAAVSEPAANSLSSIGLSITIQPMEDAAYLQAEKDRDFDLRMEAAVGGSLTPGSTAYAKWNTKGSQNVNGLQDPELDRLTDAALVELDQNKLKEQLGGMQRRILDNVYYIPVPNITSYQVVQPWLHDFYGSLSIEIVILNAQATWMEPARLPKPRSF